MADSIERFLCETCAELLEVDHVSPSDSLFALGFDSLLVISLVGAAEEAGLRLDPATVFEHETVADLAAAMSQDVLAR